MPAVLAATVVLALPALPARAATPPSPPAPRYFAPIERPPLEPPLRLSATFGEYRPGHFHAGLDFSTGETIGHPVFASLAGSVVRLRASGIGYGRSVYLQAADGRLLVYGHLDAFDEPLASYVDSAQSASGPYEQDLWPDSGRFRVASGQRLGWSGRSGTDAPHLHFEIRRGDVAYNPLLAGVSVEDSAAPVIERVDFVLRAGFEPELVVKAVDPRSDGERTMAPWSVSARSGRRFVEMRFDSVSWAEGMSEVDYVYDRGRTPGQDRYSVRLGAGAGFRPRVLTSSAPLREGAGRFTPGRKVSIVVRDVAGHEARRTMKVDRGTRPNERSPIPPQTGDWPRGWDLPGRDSASAPGVRWSAAGSPVFDRSWLGILRPEPLMRPGAGADSFPGELVPVSEAYTFVPILLPLRVPLDIAIESAAWADSQVALYREGGEGWEWMGATRDSAHHAVRGSSRRLGRFALFRDVEPPRAEVAAPPHAAPPGPYSRWALEARVEDRGSGVAARESWFEVDGRRVPSEWDAVAETLRWRPLRAPAGGAHAYELVVTDRAGNVRRRRGSFVLD